MNLLDLENDDDEKSPIIREEKDDFLDLMDFNESDDNKIKEQPDKAVDPMSDLLDDNLQQPPEEAGEDDEEESVYIKDNVVMRRI